MPSGAPLEVPVVPPDTAQPAVSGVGRVCGPRGSLGARVSFVAGLSCVLGSSGLSVASGTMGTSAGVVPGSVPLSAPASGFGLLQSAPFRNPPARRLSDAGRGRAAVVPVLGDLVVRVVPVP